MPHKKGTPMAAPGKAATISAFEKAAKKAGLDSHPGKSAVEGRYRGMIEALNADASFCGSLDLDTAFAKSEGTSNRWDYGLGMQPKTRQPYAVWVEPHSANSTGEVKTILAKLAWLKGKLSLPAFADLKALTDSCLAEGVRPYHWLSTARVAIRPGSREANQLAVNGLALPTAKVRV